VAVERGAKVKARFKKFTLAFVKLPHMSTRNHRRWAWIAIILALMLAVASSLLLTQRRPPAYRGKTVGQWVALLDSHVDYREQREEASQALAQIGAPALPELERLLSRRQNPWREIARRYAIRYRLLKPDSIHPLELQSRGCEAAYILAERANVDIHSLVPHLTYHFTNGTYADSNSGRALARSGLGGVTVLTNLLSTGSRSVRDKEKAAGHRGPDPLGQLGSRLKASRQCAALPAEKPRTRRTANSAGLAISAE
jgi:hypothetical protein